MKKRKIGLESEACHFCQVVGDQDRSQGLCLMLLQSSNRVDMVGTCISKSFPDFSLNHGE